MKQEEITCQKTNTQTKTLEEFLEKKPKHV